MTGKNGYLQSLNISLQCFSKILNFQEQGEKKAVILYLRKNNHPEDSEIKIIIGKIYHEDDVVTLHELKPQVKTSHYIHSTLVRTISEIITDTFPGIQRTAQVIITGIFYRYVRAGQGPEIQVLITGV